jgi:HAD superfamily hydrolase (TIGR01490 family)
MRSYAFFDLDHTLLPFDTQALFCNFVLRRERWRTWMHLTFLPFGVLKALRLVSTVTAKRAFLNYLVGMRREKLYELGKEFAEQVVSPWIYPELRAIIEEHRQAGRVLVLNTASPDFYAEEIAEMLGFDHCVATRVELPEAVPLMPQVIGENNKHEAKIAAMKWAMPELATPEAIDALRESWSYSDSSADLPLLRFARHAALVHPSASLAEIGKEQGWTCLTPKRPYEGKAGDMACVVLQMLGVYGQNSPPPR